MVPFIMLLFLLPVGCSCMRQRLRNSVPYGKTPSYLEQYDWIIRLKRRIWTSDTTALVKTCTGTVQGSWVLTARHCGHDGDREYWAESFDGEGWWQQLQIQKKVFHPDPHVDMMLMKVSVPVSAQKTLLLESPLPSQGADMMVGGFGTIESGHLPDQLRIGSMRVQDCTSRLGDCWMERKEGANAAYIEEGDSGCPFFNFARGATPVLVAVLSSGTESHRARGWRVDQEDTKTWIETTTGGAFQFVANDLLTNVTVHGEDSHPVRISAVVVEKHGQGDSYVEIADEVFLSVDARDLGEHVKEQIARAAKLPHQPLPTSKHYPVPHRLKGSVLHVGDIPLLDGDTLSSKAVLNATEEPLRMTLTLLPCRVLPLSGRIVETGPLGKITAFQFQACDSDPIEYIISAICLRNGIAEELIGGARLVAGGVQVVDGVAGRAIKRIPDDADEEQIMELRLKDPIQLKSPISVVVARNE